MQLDKYNSGEDIKEKDDMGKGYTKIQSENAFH